MKRKIIATLGPSSFKKHIVQKMDEAGVDIFRINISHTEPNQYEKLIHKISKWTNKQICPDTEGAQLRTGIIKDGAIEVKTHSIVDFVSNKYYKGRKDQIPLNINKVGDVLIPGNLLKIDFNSVIVQLINVNNGLISGRVLSGGLIGSNKGIASSNILTLPSFSEKDLRIFEISKRLKQKLVFLSFCSSKKDAQDLRKYYGYSIDIIAKIENARGLENLEEICKYVDGILIDRGDLSRDVALEKIPFAQSYIVNTVKKSSTPVYIATNLMENMIEYSKPTRAEVNDIVQSLESGVSGLVLAAETAIGKYPVECVRMMSTIIKEHSYVSIKEINKLEKSNILKELLTLPKGNIIKPHGGKLIQQKLDQMDQVTLRGIPIIEIDDRIASDAKQIAEGTFSPVDHFMNLEDMESVLGRNRLISDIVWTLPILFQVNENQVRGLSHDGLIALKERKGEDVFAILNINSIEKINDLGGTAKQWFGTDNIKHPGVSQFINRGNYIISGSPQLFTNYQSSGIENYALTPLQSRVIFHNNDWQKIVGFHTRNVPHMGHEYIQMNALKMLNADAIYIAPVIGRKKRGDFRSKIILQSYEKLIKKRIYGNYGVVLSGLNTFSRYSGPREAVFTAICHKNFGCSHFIVGRDHTGVRSYYKDSASKTIFDNIDIGINIISFNEIFYDRRKKTYLEYSDNISKQGLTKLSGSEVRARLIANDDLPSYLLRPTISKFIKKSIQNEQNMVC